jgi:WD40 repeat protein
MLRLSRRLWARGGGILPWLCLLLSCASALTAFAQTPRPGLHDRPVLVLDPDRHMAPIRRADVDEAGTYLVTGSFDKTVRVWSAGDGELLRTIRMPAGPGNVGRIDAVAIDPAGALIAAGGWTRWTEEDRQQQIYLFERATGRMVQRLEGLPNVVLHLTFSPDGRYLAAVLGGRQGLRVFERAATWTCRCRVRSIFSPSNQALSEGSTMPAAQTARISRAEISCFSAQAEISAMS